MKTKPFYGRCTVTSLFIGIWCFCGSGCASNDLNPPQARSHTGYVDFVTTEDDLCWQVDQVRESGKASKVFAQFAPLDTPILRLGFPPGTYRFRVNFLNRVILQATSMEVEIREGMITPVEVTLVEEGKTLVETKEASVGGTYYGRYGRSTKIRAHEGAIFQVKLEPKEPVPYKPKAEMAYGNPPNSK